MTNRHSRAVFAWEAQGGDSNDASGHESCRGVVRAIYASHDPYEALESHFETKWKMISIHYSRANPFEKPPNEALRASSICQSFKSSNPGYDAFRSLEIGERMTRTD